MQDAKSVILAIIPVRHQNTFAWHIARASLMSHITCYCDIRNLQYEESTNLQSVYRVCNRCDVATVQECNIICWIWTVRLDSTRKTWMDKTRTVKQSGYLKKLLWGFHMWRWNISWRRSSSKQIWSHKQGNAEVIQCLEMAKARSVCICTMWSAW